MPPSAVTVRLPTECGVPDLAFRGVTGRLAIPRGVMGRLMLPRGVMGRLTDRLGVTGRPLPRGVIERPLPRSRSLSRSRCGVLVRDCDPLDLDRSW